MRLSRIPVLLFGCFLVTSAHAMEEFAVVGTGDGTEIIAALAAVYMAEHPRKVSIVVPPSIESAGGIAAVAEGKEILGRSARPLFEIEQRLGLVETPIFRLPTSFYAHPSAGVKALSSDQVRDIYSGEIKNWSEVGGADLRIKVVRREETETALNILRTTMPGWTDLQLTERSKTVFSAQHAQQIVMETPGAIGFGPYSAPLAGSVVFLRVDGMSPTDSGYPSSVTVTYIHNLRTVTASALDFIAFSQSEKARILIEGNGGVPVTTKVDRSKHAESSLDH